MKKNSDNPDATGTHSEERSFGERIEHAIELGGHKKSGIAGKLGISKQAFNYLLKQGTKPRYVKELATLLRVNAHWLETGQGQITPDAHLIAPQIPLMDNQFLGHWLQNPEQNTEHLPVVTIDDNPDHFIAYSMPNDSLFPPFLERSILIFKRQQSPKHGDYVLLSTAVGDILVRKMIEDGQERYFKANNPLYKTLGQSSVATILGVLHEARYRLS